MLSTTVIASSSEYLDVTKRSAGEVADESGLTFEEYKKYNGLNPDTPEWMSENEAQMTSLAMNIINISGLSVDEFKKDYGLNIDITDTTTIGELYDSMPLSIFYADKFAEAKEIYGLGDDVTGDTLFGEVRAIIEKADMDNVERVVFSDVGYKHWAHYYITKMLKFGIIDGFDDNTIRGNDTLTRAQAAAIMYRAFFEYVNISPAFDIVVMKSEDREVTLGDALANSPLPDDVELTPAIEIFEDAWADVTIEDIAMG